MHDLPQRVDTGIRTARALHFDVFTEDLPGRLFSSPMMVRASSGPASRCNGYRRIQEGF